MLHKYALIALALVLSPVLIPLALLLSPLAISLIVWAYAIVWILYILFGQTDNPKRVSIGNVNLPHVPLNPDRVIRVTQHFIAHAAFLVIHVIPTAMRYIMRRITTRRALQGSIIENIVYSSKPDTRLDVYPLDKGQKLAPVIVFIYGGGWRSGDKKMYAPLAETFQKKGHVVVIPNYTLYPRGKIPDMMLDIQNVLLWTFHHIHRYGGDPTQIYLMGFHSGAHLCTLTVLVNTLSYLKTANIVKLPRKTEILMDRFPKINATLPQIRGLILGSGIYDIHAYYAYELKMGIEELSAMGRTMGFSKFGFDSTSPSVILNSLFSSNSENDADMAQKESLLVALRSVLPTNWLFIQGGQDPFVLPDNTSHFKDDIKETLQHWNIQSKVYDHYRTAQTLIESMIPDSPHGKEFIQDVTQFIQTQPERPSVVLRKSSSAKNLSTTKFTLGEDDD